MLWVAVVKLSGWCCKGHCL